MLQCATNVVGFYNGFPAFLPSEKGQISFSEMVKLEQQQKGK